MLEDFPNGGRLFNEGDDLHGTVTSRTGKGIDLIDFLDQPCPPFPALSGKALGLSASFECGIDSVILIDSFSTVSRVSC